MLEKQLSDMIDASRQGARALQGSVCLNKNQLKELQAYRESPAYEKDMRAYEISTYSLKELKDELASRERLTKKGAEFEEVAPLYENKDTIAYEVENGRLVAFNTDDPSQRQFIDLDIPDTDQGEVLGERQIAEAEFYRDAQREDGII